MRENRKPNGEAGRSRSGVWATCHCRNMEDLRGSPAGWHNHYPVVGYKSPNLFAVTVALNWEFAIDLQILLSILRGFSSPSKVFFLSVFNQFRRFCFEFRFFTHQLWFLGFKRFWGFFVWILVSGFDFVIVLLWSLWESLVFGDYVVGVWGIRACRVFFSWNSCFGFISCLFCREFLWISLISWDYVFGFSGILA